MSTPSGSTPKFSTAWSDFKQKFKLSRLITTESTDSIEHTHFEDVIALLIGTFLIGFAVVLLQHAQLMVGGTAGLSLLITKATGLRFSVIFWLLNLPFYYLAFRQLGVAMVVKTLIAVSLLSLMTELHPQMIHFDSIQPIYGALLANTMLGLGLLILFRHHASLGGFNLLALFVQKHYNIPAGKVQLLLDGLVLLLSFVYFDWQKVLISVGGMVVLNSILMMNFRQDRYVAS